MTIFTRPPRARGLRGKLLLWMAPIVNLGFLIAWLSATGTTRDEVQSLVTESSHAAAQSLAAELDRVLNGARADLSITARLDLAAEVIDSGDSKNFTWYADEIIKTKPQYVAIVVVDLDGVIVGANSMDRRGNILSPSPLARKIHDQPWFKETMAGPSNQVVVPLGRPLGIEGALQGEEQAIGFAAPLEDLMGEQIGLVAIFVSSAYLSELLVQQDLRSGEAVERFAIIADDDGHPLVLPTDLDAAKLSLDGAASEARLGEAAFLGQDQALTSLPAGLAWRAGVYSSRQALEQPAQAVGLSLFLAFMLCAATTTIALSFVATRLTGPIHRLTKIVGGRARASELPPIVAETTDEVGVLANAIGDLVATLKDYEAELETKVAARTSELAKRTDEMQVLLENVEQGFLVIDRHGQMSHERSKILEMWFDDSSTQSSLAALIAPRDPQFPEYLELSLEILREGLMPTEIVLAQLPRAIHDGPREYAVEYRPIRTDGESEQLLVIITDRTTALAADRMEREDRGLLAAIRHSVRNRSAFAELLADGNELIRALERGDLELEETRRIIHTLKGNCGLFQLEQLSELCHELESAIEVSEALPTPEALRPLVDTWTRLQKRVSELVNDEQSDRLNVGRQELEELIMLAKTGAPGSTVAKALEALQLEPVERRFALFEEQASTLAHRLGKELHLEYQSEGVRLAPAVWSDFWASFVHVLRNALDHGIEAPAERASVGKPAAGQIRLRAFLDAGTMVIEAVDDGRGVDWERLAAKALAHGLPFEHTVDLVEAMFSDGVSTKSQVSQISGRGVGMAAVRQAVQAHGGRVEIKSEPGRGTAFRFVFPTEGDSHRA